MDIDTWTVKFLSERCRADPEGMADIFLQWRDAFNEKFDRVEASNKQLEDSNKQLEASNKQLEEAIAETNRKLEAAIAETNRKLEEQSLNTTLRFDELNVVKKLIIAIHDAKWVAHDLDPAYFYQDASGVWHNLTGHRNDASHYHDKNPRYQVISREASMKYLLDILEDKTIVTPFVHEQLWNLCTVDEAKYKVIDGVHPHPVDALTTVLKKHFSDVSITEDERKLLDKKWAQLSFGIPFFRLTPSESAAARDTAIAAAADANSVSFTVRYTDL